MVVAAALVHHEYEFIVTHSWLPTGDACNHLLYSLNAYRYLCESVGWSKFQVLADHAPSKYYPPFVYVVVASLFAITGNLHHKMAQMAVLPFLLVLLGSAWYLARRAFGPAAALLAALLAATSPAVLFSAPALYQDVPLTAMVLANLALLQASRNFRRPGYALAAGVVLGLGMLTKQSCWAFVTPCWLMAAWGFPWRRARGWGARAGLVVIALGVPATIGAVFVRALAEELTPSRYASLGTALVAWLIIATWVVPRLMKPSNPRARRVERCRLAAFSVAFLAACGIAGSWVAIDILPMQKELPAYISDTHALLGNLTRVANLYPSPWGDGLARAQLYGLHVLHVLNPLPVAACALCMLVVVLARPRRWRRILPLAACLVFSFVFYALAFPLYRNGYMLPAVGFVVILAAGVARAHWLVAVPLVALLLTTGGMQAAAARGVSLPPSLWPWTIRSKEPLMLDEWAMWHRYLFVRTLDPTRTDVDRFFTDLATRPKDLLPVLCIIPDNMEAGFHCYASACGLEDSVYVAWSGRPGQVLHISGRAGPHVVRDTPVENLSFKSVLMFPDCVVKSDGELEVQSPWLRWSAPSVGRMEYVRRYHMPNAHLHDPASQEFLLYKVVPNRQ